MSTLDEHDGHTSTAPRRARSWRSVAAIALAGALGFAPLAGTGRAAAADPVPAPQAHRPAAKPHAPARRPVNVDIRGVGKPAYVVTKVVRLPNVAPRRAAAHPSAHRADPPGHKTVRRAHRHPRTVMRCQQDDTDQTDDFGDEGDESTQPVVQSGSRCPTARDGVDLNRLLGFRSGPRARTRTP